MAEGGVVVWGVNAGKVLPKHEFVAVMLDVRVGE